MRSRMVLPALVGGSLTVAMLLTIWLTRPAVAQLGGLAQVTRLEVSYVPATGAVEGRFHLASGLVISEALESEDAAERLFQAAQLFAEDRVRMYVVARNNRVESWQLSVR